MFGDLLLASALASSDATWRKLLKKPTPRSKFPSPFVFRYREPVTLVELRMRELSGNIRSKPNWWEEVNDTAIVAKRRQEIVDQDRQLVDKLWGGEEYFEHGDGEKQWPREPITAAQIDYIFAELKYVASQRDPETGIFATSIGWVYESRSLISPELKGELLKGVALLEDVPEDEQNWDPESNHQVLDLVQPSLYCLRIGESFARDPKRKWDKKTKRISMEEYFAHRPELADDAEFRGADISLQYQWLPTDFSVSSTGEVECLGYINNIHPTELATLYSPIMSILGRFIPMFERVLSDTLSGDPKLAVQADPYEWYEEKAPDDLETSEQQEAWEREHKWPTIPDPEPFKPQPASERINYSLKSRKIQVIVKLANIVLTPENPKYPGGSWHVEGMVNENIVATGFYHYASENITESRLEFRALVGTDEDRPDSPCEEEDRKGRIVVYGFGHDCTFTQQLGHIVAEEDKCIAFPNVYKHRVEAFELADPSKPGYRKVLAFFLVNPDTPILSTTYVPPQQEDWVFEEMKAAPALRKLSQELLDMVAGYVKGSRSVISRKEAEEHRAELMRERPGYV
ncbi:hypothetical protein C8Q74DRAFT_1374025 [Fomes fomentarius]|nr:hypothetical protein C8Q74DRAFT_1374025 [Fomes fomentarius]